MRHLALATALFLGCTPDGTDDAETDQGLLTEDEFGDAYAARFCEEWEGCNTASECPVETGGTNTSTSPCDYDPVAAQACLDGEWTCNTDFPGFEFPIPADACYDVCRGRTTTTGGSGS